MKSNPKTTPWFSDVWNQNRPKNSITKICIHELGTKIGDSDIREGICPLILLMFLGYSELGFNVAGLTLADTPQSSALYRNLVGKQSHLEEQSHLWI